MTVQNHLSVPGYLIGQAARLSGVTSANIRFYEKAGLIRPSAVWANGYRRYCDEDVHRLRLIRQLRNLDMTLDEVRTFLALDLRHAPDCSLARITLDEHIGHVRTRLRELEVLEKNLVALRSHCDGQQGDCQLIQALHAQADLPAADLRQAGRKRRDPL